MAQKDKERWNEKYQDNKIPDEPVKLLRDYTYLAAGNHALDIACGMGRHSKYLASLGFEVEALDISSVAIAQLNGIPHINAMEVDFDTYALPHEKYDLIVCTYFLERKLFSQMITSLKQDGIIILETFLHHRDNERAPSNPDFMLQSGELKTYFEEKCKLLHIEEWWDVDYTGAKTMKTSMVARTKSQTKQ